MPRLNVVPYYGHKDSRKIIRSYECNASRKNASPFDILITTNEIAITDISFLKRFHYEVMVVDEAHRLKNCKSKLFGCLDVVQTNHRVLLTGTPLQNNLNELFAVMKILQTDKSEFQSQKNFDNSFAGIMAPSKTISTSKQLGTNTETSPAGKSPNESVDPTDSDDKIDAADAETETDVETDAETDAGADADAEEEEAETEAQAEAGIKVEGLEAETEVDAKAINVKDERPDSDDLVIRGLSGQSDSIELSRAEKVKLLHSKLKPHFLRRLKVDVLTHLPPKVEIAVPCPLSKLQKEYYRALLQRNFGMVALERTRVASLRNVFQSLRHVCNW